MNEKKKKVKIVEKKCGFSFLVNLYVFFLRCSIMRCNSYQFFPRVFLFFFLSFFW